MEPLVIATKLIVYNGSHAFVAGLVDALPPHGAGDRVKPRGPAAAGPPPPGAIVDRHQDVGRLSDRLAAVEAVLQQRSDDDLRGTEPTPAELRVLALLPSDLALDQIAKRLYLSVHTVGAHRRRLYRRLGATSRQHAVTIARERGLL